MLQHKRVGGGRWLVSTSYGLGLLSSNGIMNGNHD